MERSKGQSFGPETVRTLLNLEALHLVPKPLRHRYLRKRWARFLPVKNNKPGEEGEGKMTDNDEPRPDRHINFDARAVLRKWPSLTNQRRTEATGPYLLLEGTLDDCIREFMAKPTPTRHLYEIHTSPQPPLVADVLSGESLPELARLREFL